MKEHETHNKSIERLKLIAAMVIFGSLGLFRRQIPFPSSVLALFRSFLASSFLGLYFLLAGKKLDLTRIKDNSKILLPSGLFLGINWILLFEAYNNTSVSLATLAYYMAPIMVVFASPLVLGQAVPKRKLILALVALAGMVLVSGVLTDSIYGPRGILLGLGAAFFYALVIIQNKKLKGLSSLETTIVQLFIAFITILPYVLLAEKIEWGLLQGKVLILVLIIGLIHTGLSYLLYFASVNRLDLETSAIISYLDPVVAILVSILILREAMSPIQIVGAIIVIVSMMLSERNN